MSGDGHHLIGLEYQYAAFEPQAWLLDTETAWQALHQAHAAGRAAERVDVLARLGAYRAALASQAARGLISDDELRRVDGLIDWFAAGLHEGAAG